VFKTLHNYTFLPNGMLKKLYPPPPPPTKRSFWRDNHRKLISFCPFQKLSTNTNTTGDISAEKLHTFFFLAKHTFVKKNDRLVHFCQMAYNTKNWYTQKELSSCRDNHKISFVFKLGTMAHHKQNHIYKKSSSWKIFPFFIYFNNYSGHKILFGQQNVQVEV
jgi:hypothetical protein